MNWLYLLIKWFKQLFSQKQRAITRHEKQEQELRYISTSRGGPNIPKRQPCPMEHGWKKRDSKTVGGAYYWCNRCQHHFFVRAPA